MLLRSFCLLCSLLDILIHHLWVQFLKSTLCFTSAKSCLYSNPGYIGCVEKHCPINHCCHWLQPRANDFKLLPACSIVSKGWQCHTWGHLSSVNLYSMSLLFTSAKAACTATSATSGVLKNIVQSTIVTIDCNLEPLISNYYRPLVLFPKVGSVTREAALAVFHIRTSCPALEALSTFTPWVSCNGQL